jgi:hypothetical protein
MKYFTSMGIVALLFSLNTFSQTTEKEAIDLAMSLNASGFMHHLSVISGDSLEGRATGSKGYSRAADYVVSELSKTGLRPAGMDGSWFQPVPLQTRKIVKESVSLKFSLGNKIINGNYGDDFSTLPNIKSTEVHTNEKLVFIGYGLDIPALDINDFKGVDVKGKTVVVALGLPDNFDKKKYPRYTDIFYRLNSLEKKGVSGIIVYTKMNVLQNLLFKSLHKFMSDQFYDYSENDIANPFFGFGSRLIVYAKKELIEELLEQNGRSFKKTIKTMEKGEFTPFEIGSALEFGYKTSLKDITCKNIAAVIPGSDPVLSSEYVVLSAHLDHMGIGKAVKGDSVYNGTWDNASGSSTLLTLAETYAKMPPQKRSVLFLWVTGEERGLLGSHYFAEKPTVSKGKMIADMSLDMPGGLFVARDIIPMGYRMSNLSEAVDFACEALSLEKDTASKLEDKYFERSDHISFVNAGVPSLFIMGGMQAADPKINGKKLYFRWERKTYHSPSDDMNQPLSSDAFLQGIRVHFLTSWFIANMPGPIKWNAGSAQVKRYITDKNTP